ncbi:MAG: TonB-dependent receptor, partial [Dialister sp.]|nr:TonB-dependent receptor [Dialister sp.]
MKKKMLAAALITAVAATGASVMNASAMYELDEVIVTADREGVVRTLPGGLVNSTAKLGILGNQSVMEIPYSEMTMT